MTRDRWYMNLVLYQVNPRTFFDANNDGIGDLKGITKKLDYIKSLGADCIWLMPIYPSPLKDGGYDIADYYGIHSDLGTLDDLKELINETHNRSMRIILDLVVNHTSDQCEWFKKAESDPKSPYHDYYVWSSTDQKYQDTRIIFLDTEKSNWTWSEKAHKYFWHRFYASQPDLNYDNPAVREEMKQIMLFWLNLGIDGFRADAVPYLIERDGTNCENLPETHAYLKEMREFMNKRFPDGILLAEANQWPNELRPYFSEGDEFHMAFHFPIMPRLFKSLALGNCESLIQTLKDTPKIPKDCQWCTFLRNHDEMTLEMVTEEDRQLMWNFYAPEKRMRLNLGIRRRLAPLLGGDKKKIELLYAILFSLPGVPIIYYGDEIGMGDNIQLNDRDGVRTPMQWSGQPNAGFSSSTPEKLFLPVIDSGAYDFQQINVESEESDNQSLLNRLRSLIRIRKANPILSTQEYKIENEGNTAIFSISRMSILCLNNLSNISQTVMLGEGEFKLLHTSLPNSSEGTAIKEMIVLEPYTYAWLSRESGQGSA
jgi:maltose alpha-D-glucosyltransferase/alpha-amylase